MDVVTMDWVVVVLITGSTVEVNEVAVVSIVVVVVVVPMVVVIVVVVVAEVVVFVVAVVVVFGTGVVVVVVDVVGELSHPHRDELFFRLTWSPFLIHLLS